MDARPTDPDILLPVDVAERLGLAEETVVPLLNDGTLPGRRFGDQWRVYWPAVVDAFGHDPARDVLRVPVLAARLGLNEDTVLRLLNDGSLPGRKLGRQWFIHWPAVVRSLGYDAPPSASSAHSLTKPPEEVSEEHG